MAHDPNALTAALFGLPLIIILILVLWTLAWKGFALWVAARNGQKAWFIAMLILNTVGILEIIYLLAFRADKRSAMPVEAAPAAPVEEVSNHG